MTAEGVLWSVEEVGKVLDCHPTAVAKLVRQGLLEANRSGHRGRILVSPADLLVYIHARAEKESSDAGSHFALKLENLQKLAARIHATRPEASEEWAWSQPISVTRAARLLWSDKRTLREAIDDGALYASVEGRHYVVTLAEVRSYAAHLCNAKRDHAWSWEKWVRERVFRCARKDRRDEHAAGNSPG